MKDLDLEYETKSPQEVAILRAALLAAGFPDCCRSYSDTQLHREFGYLVVFLRNPKSWGFNCHSNANYRQVDRSELIEAIIEPSHEENFNLFPIEGDQHRAVLNWKLGTIQVGCCRYNFETIKQLYNLITHREERNR